MLYVSYSLIENKEEEERAVSKHRPEERPVRTQWQVAVREPGIGFSPQHDLKLQPLEPWENTFLLFKPNDKNNGF